jgi:hypothetical protein
MDRRKSPPDVKLLTVCCALLISRLHMLPTCSMEYMCGACR